MEGNLIYRSYLLRVWQVREEAGLAWRATLMDVRTGDMYGFTGLDDLVSHLRHLTAGTLAAEKVEQSCRDTKAD